MTDLPPGTAALVPIHALRALWHLLLVESPELTLYLANLDDSLKSLFSFYSPFWKEWRSYPEAMILSLPIRVREDILRLFKEVPEDILREVWELTYKHDRSGWPLAIAIQTVASKIRTFGNKDPLDADELRREIRVLQKHRAKVLDAISSHDGDRLANVLPKRTVESFGIPNPAVLPWLHALVRLTSPTTYQDDGSFDTASLAVRGAALVVDALATAAIADVPTLTSTPTRSRRLDDQNFIVRRLNFTDTQ